MLNSSSGDQSELADVAAARFSENARSSHLLRNPQIPACSSAVPLFRRFVIVLGAQLEGPPTRVLVTGISGYIGSLVAAELQRRGHTVRGYSRRPGRVALDVPMIAGDAVTGEGLDEALDGIEVAYFLMHSMEPTQGSSDRFGVRERAAADRFAGAARRAGRRPDRLPRRPRAVQRTALASPGQSPRGRTRAARRRARVGRAARVDRDRRPVTGVPVLGALDRAPAGTDPAGLARQARHADRSA